MEFGIIAAAISLVVSTELTVIVALEVVAALLAVGFVGALYRRQQSPQYLLVLLATSTIALRGAAGIMEILQFGSAVWLDAVDHGLDVVMVLLLLAAVYAVGSAEKRVRGGEQV